MLPEWRTECNRETVLILSETPLAYAPALLYLIHTCSSNSDSGGQVLRSFVRAHIIETEDHGKYHDYPVNFRGRFSRSGLWASLAPFPHILRWNFVRALRAITLCNTLSLSAGRRVPTGFSALAFPPGIASCSVADGAEGDPAGLREMAPVACHTARGEVWRVWGLACSLASRSICSAGWAGGRMREAWLIWRRRSTVGTPMLLRGVLLGAGLLAVVLILLHH